MMRGRLSGCRVGAALGQELTEPDRDGRLWECVITDTINGFHMIEVLAPGVPHDAKISAQRVEALVERRACDFQRDSQLKDLVEASPIRVELFLASE